MTPGDEFAEVLCSIGCVVSGEQAANPQALAELMRQIAAIIQDSA